MADNNTISDLADLKAGGQVSRLIKEVSRAEGGVPWPTWPTLPPLTAT